ncbi:MAG: aminotransferase class I/II-fold pyridoxal phosphate-dependent enzyme [Spirochaetia bacterium]
MNEIAIQLNEKLKGTVALELMSDFGKRFYFPKGVAAQSTEAKKKAYKFNATIGMAFQEGEPYILPSLHKHISELTPKEAVPYAPTSGLLNLRESWKSQILKKNKSLSPESFSLPVVVPGLTNGISQIADLFISEDDNIVLPDMFWGNYTLIFQGRKQATIKSFSFFTSEGGFNTKGMEEALITAEKNGKIVLLLNFPNNPTGYTPTKEEAEEIISIITELAAKGKKILVVSDDAYFGLFYEENLYSESLFSRLAQAHENILAVKVDGTTKEDYAWGFRIGFVSFGNKGMKSESYDALNQKLTGAIRSSVSNSSRIAQSLLVRMMNSPEYGDEKSTISQQLKQRYKTVKRIVEHRTTGKALKVLPFNSGYFMSFYSPTGGTEKLRKHLLNEYGIGTISIQDAYLRIAYASVDKHEIEELYNLIFEAADTVLGK